MIYEIINPSDAYTLDTDNLAAACIVTLTLGNGAYGLTDKDGELVLPIFIGSDPEKWLIEKFGKGFTELLNDIPPSALADVFDSVVIGGHGARQDYLEALSLIDDATKKELWRDKWHDRRRSSLNDIGKRARSLAEGLRRSVDFKQEYHNA